MTAAVKTRADSHVNRFGLQLGELTAKLGGHYSSALGIDLAFGKASEIYMYFRRPGVFRTLLSQWGRPKQPHNKDEKKGKRNNPRDT